MHLEPGSDEADDGQPAHDPIDPEAIINILIASQLARRSVAWLAAQLGCEPGPLDAAIAVLVIARRLEVWDRPDRHQSLVILSPAEAARHGLKLDGRSRYWVGIDHEEKPYRPVPTKWTGAPGEFVPKVITMTDLQARCREQHSEIRSRAQRLRSNRIGYLSRRDNLPPPAKLIEGGPLWPVPGQDMWPNETVLLAADDPRGLATPYVGACSACQGKRLAYDEYCLVCQRWGLDGRLVGQEREEPGNRVYNPDPELKGGRGA
jgi:hypothetical protein